MVSNKDLKRSAIKANIKKIKDENKNKEIQKKKFREYTKRSRLNGKTKFLLNMLSHL